MKILITPTRLALFLSDSNNYYDNFTQDQLQSGPSDVFSAPPLDNGFGSGSFTPIDFSSPLPAPALPAPAPDTAPPTQDESNVGQGTPQYDQQDYLPSYNNNDIAPESTTEAPNADVPVYTPEPAAISGYQFDASYGSPQDYNTSPSTSVSNPNTQYDGGYGSPQDYSQSADNSGAGPVAPAGGYNYGTTPPPSTPSANANTQYDGGYGSPQDYSQSADNSGAGPVAPAGGYNYGATPSANVSNANTQYDGGAGAPQDFNQSSQSATNNPDYYKTAAWADSVTPHVYQDDKGNVIQVQAGDSLPAGNWTLVPNDRVGSVYSPLQGGYVPTVLPAPTNPGAAPTSGGTNTGGTNFIPAPTANSSSGSGGGESLGNVQGTNSVTNPPASNPVTQVIGAVAPALAAAQNNVSTGLGVLGEAFGGAGTGSDAGLNGNNGSSIVAVGPMYVINPDGSHTPVYPQADGSYTTVPPASGDSGTELYPNGTNGLGPTTGAGTGAAGSTGGGSGTYMDLNTGATRTTPAPGYTQVYAVPGGGVTTDAPGTGANTAPKYNSITDLINSGTTGITNTTGGATGGGNVASPLGYQAYLFSNTQGGAVTDVYKPILQDQYNQIVAANPNANLPAFNSLSQAQLTSFKNTVENANGNLSAISYQSYQGVTAQGSQSSPNVYTGGGAASAPTSGGGGSNTTGGYNLTNTLGGTTFVGGGSSAPPATAQGPTGTADVVISAAQTAVGVTKTVLGCAFGECTNGSVTSSYGPQNNNSSQPEDGTSQAPETPTAQAGGMVGQAVGQAIGAQQTPTPTQTPAPEASQPAPGFFTAPLGSGGGLWGRTTTFFKSLI